MRSGLVLVLAAGCGASSTMGKDDTAAIATQLATLSSAALASAQDALSSADAPLSTSAAQSMACAAGGTAGVSGELDGDFAADATGPSGATGTYSLDLMSTFADCALGNGLVVNGAPYLATTGTLSFRGGALVAGTITFSGALTTGNDTCNIDVVLHLPGGTASGSVCGNPVR